MGSITPDSGASIIIDIRSDAASVELKQLILDGLQPKNGEPKTLPTLLLYDSAGLKLFERITYLDEYYLTGDEIEVLEDHAAQIAERIPDNAMVVELGSGNLRKVKVLLDALDAAEKNVSYFALDLMRSELERTLAAVPKGTFKHVQCFGLHGTYDDGLEWLQRPENAGRPKVVLSLGSSIGNFTRDEAVGFVKQFADILSPADRLLIGVDACQEPEKVYHAYNDSEGVTNQFTLNGLNHANKLLGRTAFDLSEWDAIGHYDEHGGRHQAFVSPKKDMKLSLSEDVHVSVHAGEKIRIEESYKYSPAQAQELWQASNVIEGASWTNHAGSYRLHMLNRTSAMFATAPEKYAAHPVPSLDEWGNLWKVWDIVTRQMIPDEELNEKPIKLRNACIFYLGHIPTFLDMKIVEGTKLSPTDPTYYTQIFERGIDPDVDNPEHVHAHSEVPDEWPPLNEILGYQERVRQRVTELYESGKAHDDAWTGRVMWLGFEHEAMHLETLLYMLLQSDKTLPPAGIVKPDFEQLAAQAERVAVENNWFDIPAQKISIGMNDPDNADGPLRHFGWDVEKPVREVEVKSFKAKGRPITNGEYAQYLSYTGKNALPASWKSEDQSNGTNGFTDEASKFASFLHGKTVRTVYGSVPLKLALDWPVSASYDELAGCAAYMGGRIPTVEEARSIYSYADGLKKKELSQNLEKAIPAVNGHLVNDGVEESPPSKPFLNGSSSAAAGLDPNELFASLDKANVGFKHWHPMLVTQDGDKLAGQGDMSGLWEWTSSALEKQEGFEPMKLYPAYSSDFYDDKHNIVLGGSWATHPRIAGRKTFVNWYQRNYLYAWAGARLVKDI